ncbi:MAG: ATP-binding protein [Myxococcota bacterium]
MLAASTLVSAFCGGAVFLHHRDHRGSRLAGTLLAGCGFWALCQLLACLSPDPAHAETWFRLSGFGWIFIGPLALHVFMEAMADERVWVRRVRDGLYAACSLLLGCILFSDLLIRGVTSVDWGYAMAVGPLYPTGHVVASIGVTLGAAIAWRTLSRLSDAERRQIPWIAVAVGLPFTVATVTDSVFPTLGVSFPPLATPALAFLAVVIVWVVVHYGYSMLTPGPFAAEILALLPDGVAMLRPDERIRSANEGLARLAGRTREQLEGTPIGELLSWSFESEEFDDVDCEVIGPAGRRVPVSVSATAIRDLQGNVLGRVLVVRDLREVADLRRRLVTSARLAAVGELAAGIAHEINNPLAFVRSNLSQFDTLWKVVRSELPDHRAEHIAEVLTDVEELVAESLEGVDRAAEIVKGVKSFAHAGSEKRELADLNQLLDDVLRMASPQLRERVEVVRDYADVPPIPCSSQPLRQVFLNLVMNASQAMEGQGTIRVATEHIEGGVAAIVEDDGCGIAPELIDRIFDPFFTTKPVGEGTGLGLGIAYQIIEQHRGKITVESQPGRGTVFRVHLPMD